MTTIDDDGADAYSPRAMAAKKTAREAKKFTEMIAIRVAQEDADLLDDLAARLPVASRHAIAREALRIGLAVLDEDPTQLVKSATGKGTNPRARRAAARVRG